MIDREPLPLRSSLLFVVLGAVWAVTACVVFLGAVSVWVGVCNMHRQGFWVPLVAGGLTIGIALRLAFPLAGALRTALGGRREEEELGLHA